MLDRRRLLSLDGIARMLEFVASLLRLLGLFTRPVAFILSGEMAVTYFVVHAGRGHFFIPALNGGGGGHSLLFHAPLATAGGESWSTHALLARKGQ